jgi:hypothetical protein
LLDKMSRNPSAGGVHKPKGAQIARVEPET